MREPIAAPFAGLDLRRHYGHHQTLAIRAGGLIFCSGMVAIHPETGEREHGTVTSEARRIFENSKLLLESVGSPLDRLVQVHAMIYDLTLRASGPANSFSCRAWLPSIRLPASGRRARWLPRHARS